VATEWTSGEWSDDSGAEWLGNVLAVDNMRVRLLLDTASIIEIRQIIVRDAICVVNLDEITVIYSDSVEPEDLACSLGIDEVSFTDLLWLLQSADLTSAVLLDQQTLSGLIWILTPRNGGMLLAVGLDEAIDVGLNAIDPADLACAVAIERATPIPIDLIISRSLDVATRLDQVIVNFIPSLVVNDLGCGIVIEVPRASAFWGIYPEDLRCYIYLDEVDFPSFGREADTAIKSSTKKYSIELG